MYRTLPERLFDYLKDGGGSGAELSAPIKMFTFIDSDNPCSECRELVEDIGRWVESKALVSRGIVTWVIEPDMKNNIICRDHGIGISPTTVFMDSTNRVIDVVVGGIDSEWIESQIQSRTSGDNDE